MRGPLSYPGLYRKVTGRSFISPLVLSPMSWICFLKRREECTIPSVLAESTYAATRVPLNLVNIVGRSLHATLCHRLNQTAAPGAAHYG